MSDFPGDFPGRRDRHVVHGEGNVAQEQRPSGNLWGNQIAQWPATGPLCAFLKQGWPDSDRETYWSDWFLSDLWYVSVGLYIDDSRPTIKFMMDTFFVWWGYRSTYNPACDSCINVFAPTLSSSNDFRSECTSWCCQVHVVRLLMSPNSSFIALAVGNRLETFATDDAGLSWHEIHHPNAIRLSFMFHPNRPICRLTLWCLEIWD